MVVLSTYVILSEAKNLTTPVTTRFFASLRMTKRGISQIASYSLGRYRVTPLVAHHASDLIAFNYYIIEELSRKLLYGCDTGWYDERTWCFLEKERLDGVIMECTKGRIVGGYDGRHMGVEDVIRLKSRLESSGAITPETLMVTVHYSHLGGINP